MNVNLLKESLCKTFGFEVIINPVPLGWSISGLLEDNSGDLISFYLIENKDGISFEDDGSFLSNLIASKIDIENGQTAELLNSILSYADAYWDKNTFQIKSYNSYDENNIPSQSLKFLSALIQARDINKK